MAGCVQEVLPNLLYRIRLDDGRIVIANVSSSLRRVIVRLVAGSRVTVKVSSLDPHRGQVVEKL